MKNHEARARELKEQGNNCSVSLYTAFAEDTKLGTNFPQPRSIDGKCGALLTALYILKELGYEDKQEEFEKKFVEQFKYSKCIELMKYEHRCSDYVGIAARMIDEIVNNN